MCVSVSVCLALQIRVIKLLAMEVTFMERINRLRAAEIESLKTRKYLDALCVYFWVSGRSVRVSECRASSCHIASVCMRFRRPHLCWCHSPPSLCTAHWAML
jgi:hypothetical protein